MIGIGRPLEADRRHERLFGDGSAPRRDGAVARIGDRSGDLGRRLMGVGV